jgi:hypothetical protein
MDRSRPATGIGHKQQFQQMLIDRRARRLNEINLMSAHALLEFDV